MERMIFDARCIGLSFSQLGSEQQSDVCSELIVKTATSTGLKLPTNETFCLVLEKQLIQYINDCGFSNFTAEEFDLSLLFNLENDIPLPSGIDIEKISPFGDAVSVSFISRLLKNYLIVRKMIDRKLQNFIDGIGYNY